MKLFIQNTDTFQGFFSAFWDKLIILLPNLLAALLLVLLGLGIAKACSIGTRKLLQSLKFDSFGAKFVDHTSINVSPKNISPSQWVGTAVFWVILLVFLISASDTLGWTAAAGSLIEITSYLPRIFSAIIIGILGFYLASFVRTFIKSSFDAMDLSAGEVTSKIVFYGLLLIVGTTALQQAGVETTIITANISIIVGGIFLAFAIGFGYSSREILTNILSSFYARNTFSEGQIIKIDSIQGKIISIDRIHTTISTQSGELIIPNRRLISENIERLTSKNRTPLQHKPTPKQ
jgi:hypothetical protein